MAKRAKKKLDWSSGPGAKRRVAYEQLLLSAKHYHNVFSGPGLWEKLYPQLKCATTVADVEHAFTSLRVDELHRFIPSLSSLIPTVIRDRQFPKTAPAQIRFFADSLAGRGKVSPRRSRDLCVKLRAEADSRHRILRFEVYVECSCGYHGHSRGLACAKCGAVIEPPFKAFLG